MTPDPTPQSAPVRIAVMEGDGIGPEITAATMAVLRTVDGIFRLGLCFTPESIGLAALRAQGTTFPPMALEAAKAADGVILGPELAYPFMYPPNAPMMMPINATIRRSPSSAPLPIGRIVFMFSPCM